MDIDFQWVAIAGSYVILAIVVLGREFLTRLGSFFFEKKLERVKADLQEEVGTSLAKVNAKLEEQVGTSLAQVNAALDVQTQVAATQFMHLSEKRLDIAIDIYGKMQEARGAVRAVTSLIQSVPVKSGASPEEMRDAGYRQTEEQLKVAGPAIDAFLAAFNNHRFMFPDATVNMFDQATNSFTEAFFGAGYALESARDRDNSKEASDLRWKAWDTVKEQLDPVSVSITNDLRDLFGAERVIVTPGDSEETGK